MQINTNLQVELCKAINILGIFPDYLDKLSTGINRCNETTIREIATYSANRFVFSHRDCCSSCWLPCNSSLSITLPILQPVHYSTEKSCTPKHCFTFSVGFKWPLLTQLRDWRLYWIQYCSGLSKLMQLQKECFHPT